MLGKKPMKNSIENAVRDSDATNALVGLVGDAVAPWVAGKHQDPSHWRVQNISFSNQQALVVIAHKKLKSQFTGLICCADEPEVVAVSYSDGNLGMLNPYLDGGCKLERDLDGPGDWNVLSITIKAESGAEAIRYCRNGEIKEIGVTRHGTFAIVDWDSNQPIDEFLAIRVHGEWHTPVVGALPFTIDHVARCWKNAVNSSDGMKNRWNRWITAAFTELGGSDRALLQEALMEAFARESNRTFYKAFKAERRKFLVRESRPLTKLLHSA
jgi:hypothetical protein